MRRRQQLRCIKKVQANRRGESRHAVRGPTVYDQIHIGNARMPFSRLTLFDVIWCTKVAWGHLYRVTDVDDKIIQRAIGREGLLRDSEEFSQAFYRAMHDNH